MDSGDCLYIKLVHCGNRNITNPGDQEQKNIFFMPMGLFALASVLKERGFAVEILHLDLQPGKALEEILDVDKLDIVGFDCHWVNQGSVVLDTAGAVKRLKPGVFIVLGGFTASLFAEEILGNYSQVDAVIRGDGEIPLLELCRLLSSTRSMSISTLGESLGKVQNLAWKDADGRVILNDISYVATAGDMENLDFAALELLRDWESYRHTSQFSSHFIPISASAMFLLEPGRGCQYACTFCGGNCEAQKRQNNRTQTVFRSVASTLETIKKAVSYGFQTFYTCMESEESDEWYIKLFERIKQEKLDINFGYGCWRLPPERLIDALSVSCRQAVIEISPETSNLELRKKNKDPRLFYTNQQLEKCLDYIGKKENVKVQLFFGYYLSADTRETILDTIHYIIKLLMKFPGLLEIEYANFSTDPGSLYFFFPEKYRIDINVRNFRDYIKCLRENYVKRTGQPADMTVFKPTTISDEDNRMIHRKVSLFNYLFSSYRKSVSYILEKTGTPDIIMEFLVELGSSAASVSRDNKFSADEIKGFLLEHTGRKGILDPYLSGLIVVECEKQESEHHISRPTIQLFLDFEREESLVENELFQDVSKEEKAKIHSEIKEIRESIYADFDF
jgi:radical SAM superfamily enzyme YgiQ (UPF0313 family)